MMTKLSVSIFILGFATAVGTISTQVRTERKLAARDPSGSRNTAAFTELASESAVDLEAEIHSFLQVVSNPRFDGVQCATLLAKTNARLTAATPQDFAPTPELRARYRANGTKYVQELFSAKLALRERLKELSIAKTITPECISGARDLYRIDRILEDLLGEYALGIPRFDAEKLAPVLKGAAPWLLLNPKYGALQLQSGDVILSRGTAFTSAAIARLGNNDASFSHLSIVYVDPVTRAISTSEAQIEIGSFNAPFIKYLTDGKVRAAVFRFRDPTIAANSAAAIRKTIADYLSVHHTPLPYDSAMDDNDSSRYYCSELVARAYQMGSNNRVHIPAYPSHMTPKNPYFLQRIGIKTNVAFLPMDIEVDPNFDLIAEWRDYSQLNTSHMHDALITSMYDWMDRGGYVFHDPLKLKIEMNAAYNARRLLMFSSWIQSKVPECLSADQMSMIQTLGQISQLMFDHLAKANDMHMQQTGEWLTITQMGDVLNDYRKQDRALYLTSKGENGPLHQLFRPGP